MNLLAASRTCLAHLHHRFSHRDNTVAFRGMRVAFIRNSTIGINLTYNNGFEDKEIDISAAMYLSQAPAGTKDIVDIGANIGLHSLSYARSFPLARVHSFEPCNSTYQILAANISKNGMDRQILPRQIAISDRSGFAEFFETADDAFNGLKDTQRKKVRSVTRVMCSPLDDVPELHGRDIGLIKIDVEGLEAAVIAGARKTISRCKPILFIEIFCGTGANPDPNGTVRSILDLGYFAYVLGDDGLFPYQTHNDRFYNYFFVPHA